MKRSAPNMCPLCQDDVKNPVDLKCACKETVYCYECVLKWRLPKVIPWHEDSFIERGKATFAAPCPVCRSPLDLGMCGVRVSPWDLGYCSVSEDNDFTQQLVKLSVMCMAVTDRDVHEVFEVKELHISDEELLALSLVATNAKDLDAIAHFVLSKNRPLAVLQAVVDVESMDAMARFFKYIGEYVWSTSLTEWVHALVQDRVKWLTPNGAPFSTFCAFVTSFAMLVPKLATGAYVPYLVPLVEVLRTSRQTGTVTMHEAILRMLSTLDMGALDNRLVAGVEAIAVVAMYLDDDMLGHTAACILRRKHVTASILPALHGMSCRRKYMNHTVALVNAIEVLPKNETCTLILEQLLKHIKRPMRRVRPTLLAIQALSCDRNAGTVCESLGDIVRLWMQCPVVNMDETMDLVKNYMWTQRNYASETEASDSD